MPSDCWEGRFPAATAPLEHNRFGGAVFLFKSYAALTTATFGAWQMNALNKESCVDLSRLDDRRR